VTSLHAPTARLRETLPAFQDRLRLGVEGLSVSPYCVGAVREPSAVLEAYDRGINFFFLTADMHWPHYEALRRGLGELLRSRPGARDRIVVGAVSYVAEPEFAVAPFYEVLDAVPGLERLDLTIVGGVNGEQHERLDTFATHRTRRRVPGVRATGATFHDRAAAVSLLASGRPDIAFIRYNADHRGAEHDVFPVLARPRSSLLFNFKSTVGFVPHRRLPELGFDGDAWRPAVTDHYRFVLTQAQMDGVLFAPGDAAEVASLDAALLRGPLCREELSYMNCLADLHLGRARWKRTTHEAVAAAS
jgi:hypothetical protein